MAQPINRAPPSDAIAEATALSCLAADFEACWAKGPQLAVEDFYSPHHAALLSVMLRLRNEGHPADRVTVSARARHNGSLAACGGAEKVAAILEADCNPANYPTYAKILRRLTRPRALLRAARIAADHAHGDDPDTAEAVLRAELDVQEQVEHESAVARVVTRPISALRVNEYKEWLLPGYLAPGSITLLSGNPKAGKSVFMYAAVAALTQSVSRF